MPLIRRLGRGAAQIAVTCALVSVSIRAEAQDSPAEARRDARAELAEATQAFRKVMREQPNPHALLERAVAVGVLEGLVQAAFIVGGHGGDGIITRRLADGSWSAPAFVKVGGATIGAQIGVSQTDVVLLFMTKKAVDSLLDNRLEVGSDIVAVAGTAQASANTNAPGDDVLAFSNNEGLFAGAALKGAVITPDNDLNRAVYNASADVILSGRTAITPPAGLELFNEELARATRATAAR